jgi:hydrogenase/urease accessory protein HupE
VAFIAAINAFTRGSFQPPMGKTWVEVILMTVLSMGLLVAIYDRILEREIVAMAFVILNNLGHWSITATLLTKPIPDQALLLFSSLMLFGDLVKLAFLIIHDFDVRDTPKTVLYGLTGIYIAGYLAVAILELI